MMRVATYENGALHFVTDPFIVDGWTNKSHYYSAGEIASTGQVPTHA